MSVAREAMSKPDLSGRPTMTIGEVLSLLKEEFSDVSVSKIRFLESEGLIAPQRTASGYRKFSHNDLDRLRVILTLQRDSFLPLKVIKERLAQMDAGLTPEPAPRAAAPEPAAAAGTPAQPAERIVERIVVQPAPEPDDLARPEPVQLTDADLRSRAGLEAAQLEALKTYGIVCTHQGPAGEYFDEEDLAAAEIARDLIAKGIDPRNLKLLRRIAEQEATLYEQVVTPALRSRDADTREAGARTLRELTKLGRTLRASYLRQSLGPLIREDR